jgi:hypothetical protein
MGHRFHSGFTAAKENGVMGSLEARRVAEGDRTSFWAERRRGRNGPITAPRPLYCGVRFTPRKRTPTQLVCAPVKGQKLPCGNRRSPISKGLIMKSTARAPAARCAGRHLCGFFPSQLSLAAPAGSKLFLTAAWRGMNQVKNAPRRHRIGCQLKTGCVVESVRDCRADRRQRLLSGT